MQLPHTQVLIQNNQIYTYNILPNYLINFQMQILVIAIKTKQPGLSSQARDRTDGQTDTHTFTLCIVCYLVGYQVTQSFFPGIKTFSPLNSECGQKCEYYRSYFNSLCKKRMNIKNIIDECKTIQPCYIQRRLFFNFYLKKELLV